jgi:hypothetical protein
MTAASITLSVIVPFAARRAISRRLSSGVGAASKKQIADYFNAQVVSWIAELEKDQNDWQTARRANYKSEAEPKLIEELQTLVCEDLPQLLHQAQLDSAATMLSGMVLSNEADRRDVVETISALRKVIQTEAKGFMSLDERDDPIPDLVRARFEATQPLIRQEIEASLIWRCAHSIASSASVLINFPQFTNIVPGIILHIPWAKGLDRWCKVLRVDPDGDMAECLTHHGQIKMAISKLRRFHPVILETGLEV